jgi:glycosyltransferase involved in cell wall biosynthesis
MRVLIISGEDLAGGGHRAAFRLHQAFRGIGVESFMAVRRKHSSDPYVHQMTISELGWPPVGRGYLDLLPSFLCRRKDEPISLGLQTANLRKLVDRFKPDVVNLHWINGGIASICSVGKLNVPVVWTLHDMWPFTGGCHYSGECAQYRASCDDCPKIRPLFGAPLITRWVHNRKRSHWANKPLHAITPSAWMRKIALSSSLFGNAKIAHIRNCVDPSVFNGHARETTRNELGLSPNSKAILFSSANQPRKGALIIPEVIRLLRASGSNTEWRFLLMGGVPPDFKMAEDVILLPRTTNEARVASYYAAADVYALPSFEDNLPNTIAESLSCGTPVAAFPTGGIVEMIQVGHNGTISGDITAASIAGAINQWSKVASMPRDIIAQNARKTYSPDTIAYAYLACFNSVLARSVTFVGKYIHSCRAKS